MHRNWLAIPSALLLVTLAVGGVVAGGWAEVTVTDPPAEPEAGGGTAIGFQVMQHGETAVSWPRLTVVSTDGASGETIRVEATAEGAVGHYVAIVTFPAEGEWTLSYESQDLIMSGTSTIRVGPASAGPAAAVGAPTSAASTADTGGPANGAVRLAIASLSALAVGLLVALAVARLRARRRTVVTG